VSVDQKKRIKHCEAGFAGATNDKTICKVDLMVEHLRINPVYTGMKFELFTGNGDETVTETGAYAITDGGYINWRELQASMACVWGNA